MPSIAQKQAIIHALNKSQFSRKLVSKQEGFQTGVGKTGLPRPPDELKYEWLRWLDGSIGNAVSIDSFGNVYVSGHASRSLILTTDASGTNTLNMSATKPGGNSWGAFVAKYNTSGTYEWLRWLDSTVYDQGNAISTDSFGNVYVSGYAEGSLTLTTDASGTADWNISAPTKPGYSNGAFVVRYNTSGTYQWLRWLDGGSSDYGQEVSTDYFGNVYVSGNAWGSLTLTTDASGTADQNISAPRKPGSNNGAFVVKYNASGTYEWLRWLGSTSSSKGNAISTDSSGNVYVSGSADGFLTLTTDASGTTARNISAPTKPGANNGAFVVKYNTSGTYEWLRWLDSTVYDEGNAISTDSFGNVYVSGYAEGSLTLTTDASGTADLNISAPTKPGANYGVFIVKYDTSGTYQWLRWLDGDLWDQGNAISTDSFGNVYVSGRANGSLTLTTDASGTADLNISAPTKPGSNAGVFIVKYDTSGTYQWLRWLDSTVYDEGKAISIDSFGNVYVSGQANGSLILTTDASGTADLNISAPTKPGSGNGAYIAKYSQQPNFFPLIQTLFTTYYKPTTNFVHQSSLKTKTQTILSYIDASGNSTTAWTNLADKETILMDGEDAYIDIAETCIRTYKNIYERAKAIHPQFTLSTAAATTAATSDAPATPNYSVAQTQISTFIPYFQDWVSAMQTFVKNYIDQYGRNATAANITPSLNSSTYKGYVDLSNAPWKTSETNEAQTKPEQLFGIYNVFLDANAVFEAINKLRDFYKESYIAGRKYLKDDAMNVTVKSGSYTLTLQEVVAKCLNYLNADGTTKTTALQAGDTSFTNLLNLMNAANTQFLTALIDRFYTTYSEWLPRGISELPNLPTDQGAADKANLQSQFETIRTTYLGATRWSALLTEIKKRTTAVLNRAKALQTWKSTATTTTHTFSELTPPVTTKGLGIL